MAIGNQKQEDRHKRYLIEPKDLLKAEKLAREKKLDVVGIYHSHPDHPARYSDYDRDHALPNLSYVIVSVRGGEVADTLSWRLREDRTAMDEEPVEVQ